MHHYRGALFEAEQVRLEPANVFVQMHQANQTHNSSWYGYLVIGDRDDVRVGSTYTLRLEDGRRGDLRIDDVVDNGDGKFRAVFVGEGNLR